MLKPAILYRNQIEEGFAKLFYTEEMFYYVGWAHCQIGNTIGEMLNNNDYRYNWVSVIQYKDGTEKVVGFISYYVEQDVNCANRFGIISFDKGNPVFGRDVDEIIQRLIHQVHRIEWRMIGGNPIKPAYDKLCEKYHGNIVCFHDTTKDNEGKWRDSYIYEILTDKIPEELKKSRVAKEKENKEKLEEIAKRYDWDKDILIEIGNFIIERHCSHFELDDPNITDARMMLSNPPFRTGIRKLVQKISKEKYNVDLSKQDIDEDDDEFDIVFIVNGHYKRYTVDSDLVTELLVALYDKYEECKEKKGR